MVRLRPMVQEDEYIAYWEDMTRISNDLKSDLPDVQFGGSDGSILEVHLFKSLVSASCQVPRLLRIAHRVWYSRQLSGGFE